MKDVKRVISTGIWEDDLVLNEFSPEDKYFFLYILTNQYTTQLGIYHFPIKKVALEMGYSEDAIKVLLDRFETKYDLIKFSKETSEIAIKNYLRHSIVKGGKPVMDCLLKEEKAVKNKTLISYIANHLSNYIDDPNINNTVIDYINHININNDNDNDNERYVHESSTNRKVTKKLSEKNIIPPTFEMVSEYCKMRGNGIDADEFIDFYNSKGWYVGKNKMVDWQSAIRTWERKKGFKYTPNRVVEEPKEEAPIDYGWKDLFESEENSNEI